MNKKRLLSVILALLLLTACTTNKAETLTSAADNTTTLASETTTVQVVTTVASTETTEQVTQTTDNSQATGDREKYPNAHFLDGVSDYVVSSDLSDVEKYNVFEYDLVSDDYANPYTGQVKAFYYNDKTDARIKIRLPQLTEQSDLAAKINKEIIDLSFDKIELDGLDFLTIDYDAYIFDNILSISLYRDFLHVYDELSTYDILKTYHFDISDGTLKLVSSNAMLARLGVSEDRIKDFAFEYVGACAIEFMLFYENGGTIEDVIGHGDDALDAAFRNDNLILCKNANNDYYSIEIDYDFLDELSIPTRLSFTVADSNFKMALLSKPENAIGVVFKGFEEKELPKESVNGQPIKLTVLNDKSEGRPCYITTFDVRDNVVDIASLEIVEINIAEREPIYAEKLTSKGYAIIDTPNVADVYLYYASLPESTPTEALYMKGQKSNLDDVTAEVSLYTDTVLGNRIQYIYGTAHASEFKVELENDQYAALTFNPDGTFMATDSDNNWQAVGIPISKGRYTSDKTHYYLFPSEEDLANGADDVYVFEKDFLGYAIFPIGSSGSDLTGNYWQLEMEM